MDTQTRTMTMPAPESVMIQPLVRLTPIAAEKLQGLFAEKKLTGYGLRVFVSGGGCSGNQYGMAFENTTEEGDFVFESQNVRVYLDSASAMSLEGATVDYIDGPMGGGFKIENPNAVGGGCACGSEGSGGGCGCGGH